MADLVYLLDQLVDAKGKIQVPDVYHSVKPLTEEEKKLYEPIDFCQVEFLKNQHSKMKKILFLIN